MTVVLSNQAPDAAHQRYMNSRTRRASTRLISFGLAGLVVACGAPTPPVTPVSSAEASAGASEAGRVVYTMEEDGYEIGVPAAWQVRNDLFGDGGFYTADPTLPVAGWGRALERQYVALMTISVGDSQGRIRLSKTGASLPTYEVGTTIEEMDAAIDSLTPVEMFPTMTESRRDGTLGGEPALFVGIANSPHGWSDHPQFRHVFAVHEGRPVVIAFEHWGLMNATGDEYYPWLWVVDTFRFLD
jgi:hypothetical protein